MRGELREIANEIPKSSNVSHHSPSIIPSKQRGQIQRHFSILTMNSLVHYTQQLHLTLLSRPHHTSSCLLQKVIGMHLDNPITYVSQHTFQWPQVNELLLTCSHRQEFHFLPPWPRLLSTLCSPVHTCLHLSQVEKNADTAHGTTNEAHSPNLVKLVHILLTTHTHQAHLHGSCAAPCSIIISHQTIYKPRSKT